MPNLTRSSWFKRSAGLGYAVAALGITAAVIANFLLETSLHGSPTLFLFLCAIIFAAWFGGIGPGLAATVLSVMAFDYFFLAPIYSFNLRISDLPRLALFTAAALFVIGLIAAQRDTAESLLRSHADLEDKVRDLEKLNAALRIEGAALRQSEARLAEAERELRLTIDRIPTLAWHTRPDGFAEYLNKRWLDYTGLSLDRALGWEWQVAIHPEDLPGLLESWREILEAGKPAAVEARMRRFDGEYRWFLFRPEPLRDEFGNIVRWYGTNTDIEDRKRAEDALRQSEAYLAEAQRLSHTGSFGWYVSSGEIIWSAESYRIFEYGPTTRATIERVLNRVHPDDAELVRQVIERATAHKETFDFEHRLLMPDGSIKHLHVVAHPLIAEPGELQFVGAVMDVTARKQSEESLRNSEQRYQRVQADFAHAARVAMLGELTASIAHEVNQPLAAIVANGDACLRWLDRDVPQLDEVHDSVRLMISDGNRAAEVIRRVRAMAIRQAPEQTLLSIDEVIREALTFLHHEVESHSLIVTHHPNPAAPKVFGDRTQLQQVIVNLTVNAIQAMTQAGAARRTLVIRTTLSEPNTLCCTIEDSGPGIKPDHLDHLFDSFFTTKDAGMGLGLAISRSIIETHGGRIRVDNESAHGGARFSFTLPAKPH